MVLSNDQAAYLRSSWPEITAGDDGAQLGLDMFVRYFNENPQMMYVFGYTGQVDRLRHNRRLQSHGKKIIDQIGVAVSELGDQGKMHATLKTLGNKHKGFGPIEGSHFPALGIALLDAIQQKCPGVNRTTWSAGYREISDALIAGLEG